MRTQKAWKINGYNLFVHSEILESINAGTITDGDAILLARIESFVQTSMRKGNLYGCFVSNKKFAEWENRSLRTIERKLTELHINGLLIITKAQRKRYIKTCWSDEIFMQNHPQNHPQKHNRQKTSKTQKTNRQKTSRATDKKRREQPTKNVASNRQKTSVPYIHIHDTGILKRNFDKGTITKVIVPDERAARRVQINSDFVNCKKGNKKGNKQHNNYYNIAPSVNYMSMPTKLLDCTSPTKSSNSTKLAKLLFTALLKKNRLRSDKNQNLNVFEKCKSSWTKQIDLLISRYNERDVSNLIKWYCKHIADKYTPIVWSASSFATKYLQIQEARRRAKKSDPKQIKISNTTKQIVQQLSNMHWPNEAREKLPAAVELSVRNYTTFRKGLQKLKVNPGLQKYIGEMMSAYIEVFVHDWFEELFWRVCDWWEWDGNVMRDVFAVDHKKFVNLCKTHTKYYCHHPEEWDLVLEELKNANPAT